MAPKILDMPRRRRRAASITTVAPPPPRPAYAEPPILKGVDAVVAWVNQINLGVMTETASTPDARNRHKALQALVSALGRCRSVARDVELLLRAREQREGVGCGAAYAEAAPQDDAMSWPLWSFNQLAALCKLVADCDGLDAEDLQKVTDRLKHHVAGVTVRESGETATFKRRHRIGADIAGAVESYAQVQQQLEKESLTESDALEAHDDLIAYGKFMQADFEAPWHIQVIADALMRVERREVSGLILNIPPRHGKTNLASLLFASWYCGRNPTHDVIVGSHTADFAENFIGGPVRNLIQSPEFKRIFPGVSITDDTAAKGAFRIHDENRRRLRRGMFIALGRTGRPAGAGASLCLLDDFIGESDAYNPAERAHLFDQIYRFRSRFAPKAVWVVINTRYHEDDVVGVVKKRYGADRKWEIITLPVYAKQAETWVVQRPATPRRPSETRVFHRAAGEILWPLRQEDVEAQRIVLAAENPLFWSGQFMCEPVSETGAMIDISWFRRYDYVRLDEIAAKAVRTTVSVDTGGIKNRQITSTAARTAITVWAELDDGSCYLLDVVAEPWIYPDIIKNVKDVCNRWRPSDLLIEDKAAGTEVIVDLGEHRDWVRTPITAITPQGPKEVRMGVASPWIRSGMVYVPAQGVCPDVPLPVCPAPKWVEGFLSEMMHFPLSSRKDQADSVSQFLNWRREVPLYSNYSDVAASSPEKDRLMRALSGQWGARGGGQVKARMAVGRVRR